MPSEPNYDASSGDSTPLLNIDIAFEQFTLANGFTVVVSEDNACSKINYNIVYRSGSRDEAPGKSGLAHLFEHMMFRPTRNRPQPFAQALRKAGGGAQGVTEEDYTFYWAGIPKASFEYAMWLEADRMANLAGTLTQKDLDEERGIVINEVKQVSLAAGGMLPTYIREGLFPLGHPYRWTAGGSISDLESITVKDLEHWHQRFHGPNNAFMVVCGNINVARVKEIVSQYFAGIAPLSPQPRHQLWMAERRYNSLIQYPSEVAKPEILRAWSLPSGNTREVVCLNLLSKVLCDTELSPLYQYLVKSKQLATHVTLGVKALELSSILALTVKPAPGVSLEVLNTAVDDALLYLFREGVNEKVLKQAARSVLMQDMKSLMRGSSKAMKLSAGMLQNNDPLFFKQTQQWLLDLTSVEVMAMARQWMGVGYHQVNLLPYHLSRTEVEENTASIPEALSEALEITLPQIQGVQLIKGAKLRLIKEQRAPLSTLHFVFNRGALHSGLTLLDVSAVMLQQLEASFSKVDKPLSLKDVAASIIVSKQHGEVQTNIIVEALDADLPAVLEVLLECLKNPNYQTQSHSVVGAQIKNKLELGTFFQKKLLYGSNHPYAATFEGATTVTVDAIEELHRGVFRPEQLTVVASSGLPLEQLQVMLEQSFSGWQPSGVGLADTVLPVAQRPSEAKIIIFDAPGAVQSDIKFCSVMEFSGAKERQAFEVANIIFGRGAGRLENNLRTEKGWTYGLYSDLQKQVTQSIWTTRGKVQVDKTAATMAQIWLEFKALGETQTATDAEFRQAVKNELNGIAKKLESIEGQVGYLVNGLQEKYQDSHAEELAAYLSALDVEAVQNAWKKLDPENMVWIISGDSVVIEKEIRALGFGELEVLKGNEQLFNSMVKH